MINIPNIDHLKYRILIQGKLNKTKRELIKKIANVTLTKEKIRNEKTIVEFIICTQEEMEKHSKEYLNKEKATDIISIKGEYNKDNLSTKTILGTIILCPNEIKQQDNELKHFCHLIIHGILHLLDYNHEEEEDARKMQEKEIIILSKLSIISPY